MEEEGGDAETGAEDLGRDLGLNQGEKRAEEHCHSTPPGLITTVVHTCQPESHSHAAVQLTWVSLQDTGCDIVISRSAGKEQD